MSYTKEPWKLVKCSGRGMIVDRGVQQTQISSVDDAHLIVAAPELYEALKRAQRFIAKVDELHQTIYSYGLDEECKDAIAKAEGK